MPSTIDIINPLIEKYIEDHTTEPDTLLDKIDRETHLEVLKPRMLSGKVQGVFLQLFSQMIQPKRILEVGTYTGYSALCLAKGLVEDGVLYTIEVNEELKERIVNYFAESDSKEKIKLLIGRADEIIPTIDETFDLVFIDADKESYSLYYDLIIDKIAEGGYLFADNVLWSGKVISDTAKDKKTKALQGFNAKVKNDPRVTCSILPLRDGILIARKS